MLFLIPRLNNVYLSLKMVNNRSANLLELFNIFSFFIQPFVFFLLNSHVRIIGIVLFLKHF